MSLWDRVDWLTWTATLIEVAVGVWLVLWVGWPTLGGVVIGLAMGTQFSRIVRLIIKDAKLE